MNNVQETSSATAQAPADAAVPPRFTRNNPYNSTVVVNRILNGASCDKETRHIAMSLEAGMTYTPGDSVGVLPGYRTEAVEEVLAALGFTGSERVLNHYKEEISFEQALRAWLTIGKLARGTVGQYAKLPGAANVGGRGYEALKQLCGPENKARAEEYCWGREFIDLITDFPGAVTTPQELFNVLPRLAARLYSIASSQLVHPDTAETTVRVVRYNTHGRSRQGVASGQLGERSDVGAILPIFLHSNQNFRLPRTDRPGNYGRPWHGSRTLSRLPGGAAGERTARQELALLRRPALLNRLPLRRAMGPDAGPGNANPAGYRLLTRPGP